MDTLIAFRALGTAAGLGLMVGLQRERANSQLAGLRTFPLITLWGAICAMLAAEFGGWVLAAGLVSLAAMIVMGNVALLKPGATDPGLTTEIAILLMFSVGAGLASGHEAVAITVGGGTAVLLHFKEPMHGFAARLGNEDLKAIMQFVLLSLVILPVLPNHGYGPYGVWNPRQIWWMVILIVGISLGGYIVYRFLGERIGVLLGGILGGIISSTATTISYARRTARQADASRQAGTVIMIATAIGIGRVLAEIGVVAPAFLWTACPPVGIILGSVLICGAIYYFGGKKECSEMPAQRNPAELKLALFFGLLYSVALLAVAAAKDYLGSSGLYVVAVLAGLTDMDAITLSTARFVATGSLDAGIAWRLILIALMANLVFKAGSVALLGHLRLLSRIVPFFAIVLTAGALLLWLWHPAAL